ncbi:hypothetical protein O181_006861 [Austropuccinia psidii MF-1]|uniref:Uncharacterized protein n=1 Tax=Austropuccinia psidii MF-1 TaxID=1389203 RepID=A0A9Q3BJT9_9BASI|nr:hypothetical protein [Austropuccinia psidii MF-1]
MTLWGDLVIGSDPVDDLNRYYSEIHNTIENLKLSLPGVFTEKNLLAVVFHHQNQQCFHDIANALDGKLEVDQASHILPKDVLEVLENVVKRLGSSNQITVILEISGTARRFGNIKQGISDDSNKPRKQLNARSEYWILKHISPRKPCFWCFE